MRILLIAFRPVEIYWERRIKRAYARGKFLRPSDIGSGAVTTKQKVS